MRTIFVGFLSAVAISLYLYKGLTNLENYLLNAAAICASLVAIYPERLTPAEALTDPRLKALYDNCSAVHAWSQQPSLPIHHISATTLFVLLFIVAWKCAHKSLDYLPPDVDRKTYERRYKAIALAMLLFPLPGLAVAFVFGKMTHWIFFVEAAGVLTFGLYWAVKSRELALSGLERDPVEAVKHAV